MAVNPTTQAPGALRTMPDGRDGGSSGGGGGRLDESGVVVAWRARGRVPYVSSFRTGESPRVEARGVPLGTCVAGALTGAPIEPRQQRAGGAVESASVGVGGAVAAHYGDAARKGQGAVRV